MTRGMKIQLYTAFLLLLLLPGTCNGKDNSVCPPSSCGSIHNISFPFRLNTDPKHCGDYRYTLFCQNNSTLLLNLYSGKYYVQSINYSNFTIRLVDIGVISGDCSSVPLSPLTLYNFSSYDLFANQQDPFSPYFFNSSWLQTPILTRTITFMTCNIPANSPLYVDSSPCLNPDDQNKYSYVAVGLVLARDLMNECSIDMMTMIPRKDYPDKSYDYVELHRDMEFGFEISWHYVYCGKCRGSRSCYFNDINNVTCDYMWSSKTVCYLNFGIHCFGLSGKSTAYQILYRIIRSTPTVLALLGKS
ncbi:hypothetical protein M5689_022315 [Euphorbia peplus]|nr:hypothetical protein M5689_022315 [Euphorbia peplus]